MRKTLVLLVALAGLSASIAFADQQIQPYQDRFDVIKVKASELQLMHVGLVAPDAVAPAAAEMVATDDTTVLQVVIKQAYVVDKLSAPLALSEKMAAYTKWGNQVLLKT